MHFKRQGTLYTCTTLMTTEMWPMRPSGEPQFDIPDLVAYGWLSAKEVHCPQIQSSLPSFSLSWWVYQRWDWLFFKESSYPTLLRHSTIVYRCREPGDAAAQCNCASQTTWTLMLYMQRPPTYSCSWIVGVLMSMWLQPIQSATLGSTAFAWKNTF